MAVALGDWNILWVLGGDYNTIRFLEERVGCQVVFREMELKYIDYHFLIDPPLIGASFTWARSEGSTSLIKS